jgi:O-antigen/teichoic acid export membrane protein
MGVPRGDLSGRVGFNIAVSVIAARATVRCLGAVTSDIIDPAVADPPRPDRAPLADARRGRVRAIGAGGLALARIVAQAMQFALFLYAARVLSTADFGVFSLAYTVIVGLSVLAEAGWREWVLCASNTRQIDEAGGTALITGAVIMLGGVGLLIAGQRLGINPALIMVAGLLLPWIVARPLVCVQMGVLTRAARLTHIAVVQSACELAGLITGVVLLHRGAGLAALAWAKLALLGVELVGYTIGLRRLGLALPGRDALRRMTRFSLHITAARALTYLQGNMTTLVIGAAFSPALVGLYRAAMRLSGMAQEVIREPARMVGWSWLRTAHDHDQARASDPGPGLIAAAHRFLDLAVTVGSGLLIVLALESTTVVHLLLGAKWAGASVLVALLALGMIARLPQALAEPLFPLLGKAWLTRHLALLTAGAGLACFLIALPFGVIMVALADMVAALLMLGPMLSYLVIDGGLSPTLVLRPFVLAVLAGLGCAGLAFVLPEPGTTGGLLAIALLARDALALIAAYAALQLALRRAITSGQPFRSPKSIFTETTR